MSVLHQFGSEGRAQIQDILEEAHRSGALEEMDEDDSDGEEDDDEEEDEEECAEEEEEDYTDDGEDLEYLHGDIVGSFDLRSFPTKSNVSIFQQTSDSNANDSNLSIGSENLNNSNVLFVGETELLPNTVETFCNTTHPSVSQFNALEENDKIYAFRNYLKVSVLVEIARN